MKFHEKNKVSWHCVSVTWLGNNKQDFESTWLGLPNEYYVTNIELMVTEKTQHFQTSDSNFALVCCHVALYNGCTSTFLTLVPENIFVTTKQAFFPLKTLWVVLCHVVEDISSCPSCIFSTLNLTLKKFSTLNLKLNFFFFNVEIFFSTLNLTLNSRLSFKFNVEKKN